MVRYECPVCGKMFNTTAAIKFHIETYHQSEYSEMVDTGKKQDICVKCYPYSPFVKEE